MDHQEAIKVLESEIGCVELDTANRGYIEESEQKFMDACKVAISAIRELKVIYDELGTLEEIKNAVEKQIPKSPTYDGDGYAPDGTFVWDTWICPSCGTRYEVDYEEHDYCPNCGQAILWEESDEQ